MSQRAQRYVIFDSPYGPMGAAYSDLGLTALTFPRRAPRGVLAELRRLTGSDLAEGGWFRERLANDLAAYFAGRPVTFEYPYDLSAGPQFHQRVWRELLRIPRGEVRTYGSLARALGCPGGARAVGQAVGANPIGILIP